jgi:hypothetical protein
VTDALHGGPAADPPSGGHHRDSHGGLPDCVPSASAATTRWAGISSASSTLATITSSQLPATAAAAIFSRPMANIARDRLVITATPRDAWREQDERRHQLRHLIGLAGQERPGPAGFPCAVPSGRRTAGDGRSSRRPRSGRRPLWPGSFPGPAAGQLDPAQPAVPVLHPQRPAAPGALALVPVAVAERAAGPAPYLLHHSPGQAVGAAAGQVAGRVPGPAHLRAAAGCGRRGAWA